MSPVLMGNTVVWKPSTTAILSNYYLMKIYEEAGVPAGVVNFIPGSGAVIGKEIFASKDLAGVHFTGSSATFNTLWKQVGENIANYRSYPRLVGETGGKDFIFVHPSAVAEEVHSSIRARSAPPLPACTCPSPCGPLSSRRSRIQPQR